MSVKLFVRYLILAGILFLLFAYASSWLRSTKKKSEPAPFITKPDTSTTAKEPTYYLGIPVENYRIEEGVVHRGEVIGDILADYNVAWEDILTLVKESKAVYDLTKIRAGNSYSVYLNPIDSLPNPAYFVYQIDAVDHVKISLRDSLTVAKVSLPVALKRHQTDITITSSLYEAFAEADLPITLALKLADIYAWTVDFYRLEKNDKFYCLYENRYVNGDVVGTGDVIAACYINGDDTLQAYRFYHDSLDAYQYFSHAGENLQRSMLKSPLEFGRITSGFTRRRFHPVQKRYKAHLGTDYAAPRGTPILAVGNGTIIKAERGRYNGNYVKIRHNNTYTSQYLHMSGFAKKTRVGAKVQQGDVIGYVGATGLATGPHVCFRLWKNGRQVNHLREKFSPAAPLPQYQMPLFADSVALWQPSLLGLQDPQLL